MLELYGWRSALQQYANNIDHSPARVIARYRDLWRVVTEHGERTARLSGRFAFEAAVGGYPVVGDWIAASEIGANEATIHSVLPRTGVFKRRAAGGEHAQIVAANIDVALIVAALNGDLNPRRIERYLVAARDANAAPVVVLTKADLSLDPAADAARIAAVAAGAPVIALSALEMSGVEQLDTWLTPGATAVLLGSSGAGKSTLLNALAGAERMPTGAIRASDDRGRHTTTHRELFRIAGGALIIDTPGMRELGLLAEDGALDASFADVAALAARCGFHNCTHESEPGCAVSDALASGALEPGRWRGYKKLQRELAYAARREDPEAEAAERLKWKSIHKAQRARYKARERGEE